MHGDKLERKKLIDFSCSLILGEEEIRNTILDTSGLPPEMLSNDPQTYIVHVWIIWFVFFEMITILNAQFKLNKTTMVVG